MKRGRLVAMPHEEMLSAICGIVLCLDLILDTSQPTWLAISLVLSTD
jgi:hypothetical protein